MLRLMVVVIFYIDADTDFAIVTMEEVFPATCLACATFAAVEYLLARVVVKQVANAAEVLSKSHLALPTRLLWRLDRAAPIALDFFDRSSIELVRVRGAATLLLTSYFELDFVVRCQVELHVVAESAWVELIALLAFERALAVIVHALLRQGWSVTLRGSRST